MWTHPRPSSEPMGPPSSHIHHAADLLPSASTEPALVPVDPPLATPPSATTTATTTTTEAAAATRLTYAMKDGSASPCSEHVIVSGISLMVPLAPSQAVADVYRTGGAHIADQRWSEIRNWLSHSPATPHSTLSAPMPPATVEAKNGHGTQTVAGVVMTATASCRCCSNGCSTQPLFRTQQTTLATARGHASLLAQPGSAQNGTRNIELPSLALRYSNPEVEHAQQQQQHQQHQHQQQQRSGYAATCTQADVHVTQFVRPRGRRIPSRAQQHAAHVDDDVDASDWLHSPPARSSKRPSARVCDEVFRLSNGVELVMADDMMLQPKSVMTSYLMAHGATAEDLARANPFRRRFQFRQSSRRNRHQSRANRQQAVPEAES